MNDIGWHFENFTAQMVKHATKEFQLTNFEYQEIECYLHKHEDRFNSILDSLNEDDKKFVKEYITNQVYKVSCANDCLYLQGYKDCVKLLDKLGVI
ncbi:hypothetical protein AN1V17_08040 [Vallitalea sediminicola]